MPSIEVYVTQCATVQVGFGIRWMPRMVLIDQVKILWAQSQRILLE